MNVQTELKKGIGSICETTDPNVLLCGAAHRGFVKLTLDPNSSDVKAEDLFRPFDHEKFGDGPHPEDERLNDGKVSPDGKFFCGSLEQSGFFAYDSMKEYAWTMNGNNKMASLLYRYDADTNTAVP